MRDIRSDLALQTWVGQAAGDGAADAHLCNGLDDQRLVRQPFGEHSL